MTMLLISLLILALVCYLAELAMPQYARAIRIVGIVLAMILLLRFAGVFVP